MQLIYAKLLNFVEWVSEAVHMTLFIHRLYMLESMHSVKAWFITNFRPFCDKLSVHFGVV